MKNRLRLLCLAAIPLAACAEPPATACVPTFTDAVVRVMPVDMPMQAGYVTVSNPCKTPVSITRVSSAVWKDVSLHSTRTENGVSKMRALPALTLAPGTKVQMSPGGTHIMLMSPTRKISAGQKVELQFTLGDGRSVRVPFMLKAI